MVKAFPVTNCKGDYASLFLEVLNVHIATLTKESLNDTFLFQKYFERSVCRYMILFRQTFDHRK